MAINGNITLEGAKLVLRNFSGKPTKVNPAGGKREFGVLLDTELAHKLEADGWHVKWFQPSLEYEDSEPQPWLPVKCVFGNYPPLIMLIGSRGKTKITEDLVYMLDGINIKSVDIIIRPYPWEFGGKSGVSAYVQSLYVIIEEDYLAQKYADIPESEG